MEGTGRRAARWWQRRACVALPPYADPSAVRALATSSADKDKPVSPHKFFAWERKLGQNPGGLPDWIEKWNRKKFYGVGAALGAGAGAALVSDPSLGSAALSAAVAGYWAVGLTDIKQKQHAIRTNFPVLGHIRYLLESVRPEIRQYFIESDNESRPFSREQRSVVYQRAKNSKYFCTGNADLLEEGYEWVSHSIWPKTVREDSKRVVIGNKQCSLPYSASRLNVSAMSYGAISDAAIRALNKGAKQGGFYTNTGEGGVSRFHLEHGGDIVWNIGTGYFGCRDRKTGRFDPQQFVDRAKDPGNAIKMIELKLSQGAKPAHGGLLPGAKVTTFIAEARGVEVGEDCHSPASHAEFQDPRGLVLFVQRLRELSGGKPVGFKLCMGRPAEVAAIVGAMVELQIFPDFITVDGSEGGTGAAPPEFSNHVGWPLSDAVTFIHNTLEGAGVREHVKIIASGKILSGFSMVRTTALGADVMNSARAMLFSIGCIQSLKCNTNKCPTGIATQDPELIAGLDVQDKSVRVYNYQRKTLQSFFELIGAVGLDDPRALRPDHVMRRMAGGTGSKSYAELFPPLERGKLLGAGCKNHPTNIQAVWDQGQKMLRDSSRSHSIAFKS